MIIDDILSAAGFLKNNLQSFIEYWTKGVQIIADSLFDPAEDNSHEIFTLPPEFYLTVYKETRGKNYTDAYLDKSGGMQPFLFAFTVKLQDGVLSFPNLQYLGRTYSRHWEYLTDAEADALENLVRSYPLTLETYSDYPTEPVLLHYSGYSNYSFKPRFHDPEDMGYEFTDFNGGHQVDSLNIQIITGDMTMSGDYIDFSFNLYDFDNIVCRGFFKQPFMMVTDSMTAVNDYITSNDADHNYSDSVTTGDGDDFTVYYGDNYVIYYIPTAHKLSYNDIQTTTQRVVNKIVSDNPSMSPIHVPTYEENKYGPEPPPEPDIDADIEVEMPLNDAAYGAGLSHYYVTTVDAPVLDNISEAMSTWDIKNTGKDLYRNLLSCRITKVGPIPATNSTFVIYGEELLHNGAPITINKITGNPSMDLGEYEILPKFHDFRDYAPYTKIEMFIPYCGWVALPSHVMSSEEAPKIITGTLLCDIISGTCKAVIKCNDTVIAEASGFTAVDVPFTGENVGMKMAGIASAITSYGKSAAGTVGAIASGAAGSGAGSAAAAAAGAGAAGQIVSLLGSYAQLYSAFNANYTEICGKTGDGCNVAGLSKVYIKIQRPKTGGYSEPDYVPDDFGHTTGFLCMQKKQLSELEGFTQCANVDTSGIAGATERERQMIKRYLESGVILNFPEPPEPEE